MTHWTPQTPIQSPGSDPTAGKIGSRNVGNLARVSIRTHLTETQDIQPRPTIRHHPHPMKLLHLTTLPLTTKSILTKPPLTSPPMSQDRALTTATALHKTLTTG